MKTFITKITGFLLASMLVAVPALAVEQNFGAGSLVIPMDQFYQDNGDGGMLNAYGLIFALLGHTDTNGDNDITVYWIINDQKVNIADVDFVVEDTNLSASGTTSLVAGTYDHNNGTTALAFNTADGDLSNRLSYSGGPFVIDVVDAAVAKTVINDSAWAAVNVHEMQVPFKAPVYREMKGTPPRIALMNDSEDTTKGNASEILEAYLRYAGICKTVYDIVTPNQIRDGALFDSATGKYKYDFLWTPHWAGYEGSYATDDGNSNGISDVDDIVQKVREFVEAGNGLFAECASIEVFEHSDHGHFLTDKGIAQNGGWNDQAHIVYYDVTTPNTQIGDFSYSPTGGHLHNWRPFQFDDNTFKSLADQNKTIQYMNGKLQSPQDTGAVTYGNDSVYNDTVTRFTMDTGKDDDAATTDDNWDYYTGGYIDGNSDEGYVVYLGGHKYAECKTAATTTCTNKTEHRLEFTFKKNLVGEQFLFSAVSGTLSPAITFNAGATSTYDVHDGTPLMVEADAATKVNNNVLSGVLLSNLSTTTGISNIDVNLTWGGDTSNDGQYITKVVDTTTNTVLYTYAATTSVGGWVPNPKPKPPAPPKKEDNINAGTFNEYEINLGKVFKDEVFTVTVYHDQGQTEFQFTFPDLKNQDAAMQGLVTSGYSGLSLQDVLLDKNKNKIKKFDLKAAGTDLVVSGLTISWTGGDKDQNIKDVKRKKQDGKKADLPYNPGNIPGVTLGTASEPTSISMSSKVSLDAPCSSASKCGDTTDCTIGNAAGVRYVLNTLFNIKYQLTDHEYVRSAPIEYDNYMYQGTFDYPSYTGHFRKVDLTKLVAGDTDYAANTAAVAWDVADSGHIKDARDGNCVSDGATPPDCSIDGNGKIVRDTSARKVITASKASGSWEFVDFDKFHLNDLRAGLDVTPANGDDTDEIAVIERLRGKIWDATNSVWLENSDNRMGGSMHSAPAVSARDSKFGRIYDMNHNGYDDRRGVYYDVNHDQIDDFTGVDLSNKAGAWIDINNDQKNDILETRAISTSDRLFVKSGDLDGNGSADYYDLPEVAYVGDLSGMLHAIDVATGDEIWAFIPPNLLGKLKNNRTDPNATADFAAIDASVTLRAVLYDHDGDGVKEWRKIITCAEGTGGTSIFAMDVTDPEYPIFLWEATDNSSASSMGFGGKTAMGKVAEPVYVTDSAGNIVYYAKDSSGNAIVDSADGYILYSLNGGSYSYFVWKDGNGDGTLELVSHAVPTGHDPTQEKKGLVKDYEIKHYVYVATGFRNYINSHGGINVYAYDLETGQQVWQFTQKYLDSVNDIPGAVSLFDTDGDSFVDRLYVGDMDGRMWELDAVDGSNPHGQDPDVLLADGTVTMDIPLYNAGTGKPISVSPALGYVNSERVVVFGTGGADWADQSGTYSVYMVSATAASLNNPAYYDPGAGSLKWKYDLDPGFKVWSSPRLYMGNVYVAVASGTMESANPKQDLLGSGKLMELYGSSDNNGHNGGDVKSESDTKKIRATLEVAGSQSKILGVTADNQLITASTPGQANQTDVVLKSWRTR